MTDIFIIDDQHPEDNAMLQALYSRDPQSVVNHMEKVKKVGSGKFMAQYYVGYNHQSIGDCGTTTMYVEQVSMLAAKAIQDSPLYNGQEASTRFLDMASQEVLNPVGTHDGMIIQKRWMAFYKAAMEPTIEHLYTVYPYTGGDQVEHKAAYHRAIKARAFDILRGFLPAGCTTLVSWHSTLRHSADHLDALRHYPITEVRQIAETLRNDLIGKYPHSFTQKTYEATDQYQALVGASRLYDPPICPEVMECTSSIDAKWIQHPLIQQRPPHATLPHFMNELGQITYEFLIDFGGFRDLQRHRNGVCRMPRLSTRWGFHPWYVEQLPESLRDEALGLISDQMLAIGRLEPHDPEDLQYYVAMGFRVPCRVTRGLPGTLYLIEIRTPKTVHPTMRKVAQDMATTLQAKYPDLPIHADFDAADWDVKRGTQDIVAR